MAKKIANTIGCYDRTDALISLFSRRGMFGGPVCKLYKAEILNNNNIRFREDIKICEDNLFCYEYIKNCNRIIESSECLYFYTYNKASASNKKYIPHGLEDLQLHFRAYWEIEKTINEEDEKVNQFFLTMKAQKCIRLIYRHDLLKYLSENDVQYIRKCIKEAYEKGEKSELMLKKGSYIMGWMVIASPKIAKWLCKTRRLYKKKV